MSEIQQPRLEPRPANAVSVNLKFGKLGGLTTVVKARPESLLMTPFFNDWTDGHLADGTPRSSAGLGIDVDPSRLGEALFTVGAK